MKVLVVNNELKESHKEQIKETTDKIKARVCFTDSEDQIPDDFVDAEVIYGFAMRTIAKNKNLKWLCVPSAGVDYLLKPGVFANEDCIITNSAGAYGVSIAEHMIMVSLMLMRQMNVIYRKSVSGEWGNKMPQKSLKGSRITVLGTGDIGCTFAQRVHSFEPASLTGVCRSGICGEPSFDRILSIDHLDEILPETDLLIMCLPETADTKGILSKERIQLLPDGAYVVNVGRGYATKACR
ncbi:NAD(P)-dependent oxidoreductase [Butyrivibrio sp. INlla16]|uniref:NAD(P)-dependent oxidoreductase n=1 Tax=Butyrivibrio sp. INlla16 TaxID=1520807 RepID=UPI00088D376F|nr:NAD(P)-dependent oxidoreductase [Butyrivibrio sp. INlla16]SDB62746.1 Phosphoglycerate dehydrogenase [Butyrivibrio sp. INlla16]